MIRSGCEKRLIASPLSTTGGTTRFKYSQCEKSDELQIVAHATKFNPVHVELRVKEAMPEEELMELTKQVVLEAIGG